MNDLSRSMIGTAWEEIRVGVRVVIGVIVRPRHCPRCGGLQLDAMPPATPGAMLLDAVGFRVIRCHTCQQAFVTW